MTGGWLSGPLLVLCLMLGHRYCVEISLENLHAGYFIKSLWGKYRQHNPHIQKESFIISQPIDMPTVQAKLGPFKVAKSVPKHLVDTSSWNGSSILDRMMLNNLDISVHLVSGKLTPENPLLQLLIHAGSVNHGGKHKSDFYSYSQRWCGQLFIQHLGQELSSVCVLSDKYNACVAGIGLPIEWWADNDTSIQLYYSLSQIRQNQECASAANTIVPGRAFTNKKHEEKTFLKTLELEAEEEEFTEIKDQHLLIAVPTRTYHPGVQFQVPVKLEADSDLQVFVMRARTRNGLKIVGAHEIEGSPWQVHIDISDRQKSATVTAYVKDTIHYVKRPWTQEVFKWQLEVEDNLVGSEVGRIIWSIEYEVDGQAQEKYMTQESRLVSKINIEPFEQEKLIPILKVTEIINIASLTGRPQSYPFQLFAVNDAGDIHDVTRLTACHSSDNNVLKVSKDCSAAYVDGTEKRGSENISIIAKSGQLTTFVYLKVWIPEERLDIQLSDSKLSQIKGWKAPKHRYNQKRKRRGVDLGLLSHHVLYPNKAKGKHEDRRQTCKLRYQQSFVDIYTRFCIQSNGKTEYYKGRKVFFRITDLVKGRLRISDSRIASLDSNVIQGQSHGRTEVQVLSPTGRVMAAKEIRVGHNKVTIERLLISLVTGLNLEIKDACSTGDPVGNTLMAVVQMQNKLQVRYQEGILDIAVLFSDGTTVPLKHIDPEDYQLDVTSLNHRLIRVGVPYKTDHQPRVVAVGQGDGEELKVALKLGSRCIKKKVHPLALSFVYVNLEFTEDQTFLDKLQSDGHYDNRASDRWNKDPDSDNQPVLTIDVTDQDNKAPSPKTKDNSKLSQKDISDTKVILGADIGSIPQSKPKSEPQLQQVVVAPGLSALEIVMYVLLAVFCMAIIVFTVNCVVFTVRYRRKQMPKEKREKRDKRDPVSSARDWVWIGQATLERNAVNTHCSQTLMPEEDFNGNQMRARLYSGTGSTGSGSASGSASGSGSNRNSTVSTYMGSECSIRITANPLSDANPPEENPNGAAAAPEWDYEAMGLTYDQFKEYLDNLKESTA